MANLHFAQMHINKIKSTNKLSAAYAHNCRKDEVPNANQEEANKNDLNFFGDSDVNFKKLFEGKIKSSNYYKNHSVKSNNVLALEIVCSLPKELASTIDTEAWKEATLNWAKENFNDPNRPNEENIISAVYHGDEAGNPHMHIVAIPFRDGKLNAKSYLSNSIQMSRLQDSYARTCKEFGLERGIKGTRTRHEKVQHFYGLLDKEFEKNLPHKEKEETWDKYYERINNIYKDVSIKAFGLEKENEKLKDQLSAISREPDLDSKIEHYQYVSKMKELEEKERSLDADRKFYNEVFNDYKGVKQKSDTLDMIDQYLREMEDRERAEKEIKMLNELIDKAERKYKKKKEKEKEKTKG